MKLLIAYDGSACADAALDDLTHAGLPAERSSCHDSRRSLAAAATAIRV